MKIFINNNLLRSEPNHRLKYTNNPICKESDCEEPATSDYWVDNLTDFIGILDGAKINKE